MSHNLFSGYLDEKGFSEIYFLAFSHVFLSINSLEQYLLELLTLPIDMFVVPNIL